MDIDPRHVDEVLDDDSRRAPATRPRTSGRQPVAARLHRPRRASTDRRQPRQPPLAHRARPGREGSARRAVRGRPRCRSCPRAAERLRGTGHPQEQVMASAEYLAQHLAEVPAIVIPTIIGRHDGNGRPGLFDSVIQAAWSFCLALRARGLGTTWVTAALEDEARVKEILGIPAHMTEIVLFPVAWTKGTEFRRARRHPARAITYFDRFGTTSEHGPGESLRFEDGPGAIVEIDIDAAPAVVWRLVERSEGADRVLRRVHRRRVAERRTRGRRGVRRAQPSQGGRRVGAAVHRRRLRRTDRLRLAHVRSRQPRAHGGASTSNRPPAAPGCGSATPSVPARRARRRRSPATRARRPASCAAASTRCRPTCSAPSRASSSSPKSRDDPARRRRRGPPPRRGLRTQRSVRWAQRQRTRSQRPSPSTISSRRTPSTRRGRALAPERGRLWRRSST